MHDFPIKKPRPTKGNMTRVHGNHIILNFILVVFPNAKRNQTTIGHLDIFALIEPLDGIWWRMRWGRELELLQQSLRCYVHTTPSINDEGTYFASYGASCMKDDFLLFIALLSSQATCNAPKIIIIWFTKNYSGRLNDRRHYCRPDMDKAYRNHLIQQLMFTITMSIKLKQSKTKVYNSSTSMQST